MSHSESYEELRNIVEPGSMTGSTIAEILSEREYGEYEAKLLLADAIEDGVLEEHPEIDGAWRVPDDE